MCEPPKAVILAPAAYLPSRKDTGTVWQAVPGKNALLGATRYFVNALFREWINSDISHRKHRCLPVCFVNCVVTFINPPLWPPSRFWAITRNCWHFRKGVKRARLSP